MHAHMPEFASPHGGGQLQLYGFIRLACPRSLNCRPRKQRDIAHAQIHEPLCTQKERREYGNTIDGKGRGTMWRRANAPYGAEEGPAPDDPAACGASGWRRGRRRLHFACLCSIIQVVFKIHEYHEIYTFKFMNTLASIHSNS